MTSALAACAIAGIAPAHALVVLADSFDDGDVSDWTKTTNFGGVTNVTVRTDSFVSPGGALFVYLDAPPGGTALFVRASRSFDSPRGGDHVLEVAGRSEICDICTISYEVMVDGVLLAQRSATSGFEPLRLDLPGLAAGAHTVTLGMTTTLAISGRFNASFDDLVISAPDAVPPGAVTAPGAAAVLLGGLLCLKRGVRRRG